MYVHEKFARSARDEHSTDHLGTDFMMLILSLHETLSSLAVEGIGSNLGGIIVAPTPENSISSDSLPGSGLSWQFKTKSSLCPQSKTSY